MRFEIKALKGKEGIADLAVDALNEKDAILQIKSQGYAVLSIRSAGVSNWGGKRRPKFLLVLFSQELLALLDAGLSLVEAMSALAEKEHRSETRKVLEQLIAYLYEGQPLSAALQRFPDIFPALYVATVRASEKTGGLSEAMKRYVAYQQQINFVRKKIISAAIYPVLLMAVGGLVVLFLMAYVVPKFSKVYEGSGGDLPWLSQLLLTWGQLLQTHGLTVLAVFMTVLLLLGYGLSRQATRAWLMLKLWQAPGVGERMHVYQLARFYRTLGMLLKGGIPIVPALDMVSGLLQPLLRARLKLATQGIREGHAISQAMEEQELTTPVASRMLRVGERTGDMGEMMERIASFYDEEMARWVEWFTRLFEPILMALIGVVIGVIVVLMYLPIFELAGSMQ